MFLQKHRDSNVAYSLDTQLVFVEATYSHSSYVMLDQITVYICLCYELHFHVLSSLFWIGGESVFSGN